MLNLPWRKSILYRVPSTGELLELTAQVDDEPAEGDGWLALTLAFGLFLNIRLVA